MSAGAAAPPPARRRGVPAQAGPADYARAAASRRSSAGGRLRRRPPTRSTTARGLLLLAQEARRAARLHRHPDAGRALRSADEIARNAYAAAFRDPRFPPVGADELDALSYSVDVLSAQRAVRRATTSTRARYGVIVSAGVRRGVLLPDLAGVDTVERQLAIALQKAGIARRRAARASSASPSTRFGEAAATRPVAEPRPSGAAPVVALFGPPAWARPRSPSRWPRRSTPRSSSADSMQVYAACRSSPTSPRPSSSPACRTTWSASVDPREEFSVARYAELAQAAIDDVLRPRPAGRGGRRLRAVPAGGAGRPDLRRAARRRPPARPRGAGGRRPRRRCASACARADPATSRPSTPTTRGACCAPSRRSRPQGERRPPRDELWSPRGRCRAPRGCWCLDVDRERLRERVERASTRWPRRGLLDEVAARAAAALAHRGPGHRRARDAGRAGRRARRSTRPSRA